MAALTSPVEFADADIFHARLRPNGIRFRYRVMALFIDVDKLAESVPVRLFSIGRFNIFSFNSADHGPRDGSSLRAYIDRMHDDAGLPRPHSVLLTCFPRILGYVFNPISTYACADETGKTTSVVYEVRNTFGQHHTYLFPVNESNESGIEAHECDKLFYVSPFMDMPMRYRFMFAPPHRGKYSLNIIERDRDGVVLTALMRARVFAPTTYNLLIRLLKTPLAGFRVLAGIHVQALRLVLRGHRIRPRPAPPPPVSLLQPGDFSLSTVSPRGPTNV